MSVRLANIRRGAADVIVDGQVIGWVARNSYEVEDADGKWRGRQVTLWDAIEPCKWGGGEVSGMPYQTRREAVAALLERISA